MSFGILNLKQEKKDAELKGKVVEVENLVTGNGISSFLLAQNFAAENKNVSWVSSKEIDLTEYTQSWEHQLPLLRGPEVAEAFQQLLPNVSVEAFQEEPLFYKDQAFKSFNGRAKPHPLLHIEGDFVPTNYQYDLAPLIEQYATAGLGAENKEVIGIRKTDDQWVLRFADGDIYRAKKLYWGEGRKDFYDRLESEFEQSLSEEEKNSLLCFGDLSLLTVRYTLKKVVQAEAQSYFIPQSQTHDQGHYIFDVQAPTDGKQVIFGSFFVDSDTIDKEEIGRRIRRMRKAFMRVNEDFLNIIKSEEVKMLPHHFPVLRENFDFDPFEQTEKLPYFIGPYAPWKKAFSNCEFPFMINMMSSFVDHRIN